MKTQISICISIVFLMALSVTNAFADQPPTEMIQLTNKMGAVPFSHNIHSNLTCQTCHHTGNFEKCSACHETNSKAPSSKQAFHALCKDCHRQEKSGPTGCKACHQKN